jgi:hypothetical protein
MTTYSITDPIVDPIGIVSTSQNLFTNTSNVYDIAIGGQPFLLASSDKYPYQRQTATYRKQQFDNTKEVGEQSFEGWWLRSQSSFHLGAGINYLDPYLSENVQYRFNDSAGVDVWTPGQVTMLPDTTNVFTLSDDIQMFGAIDSLDQDCIFVSDNSTLTRIAADGTDATVAYGGSGSDITSLAQDGLNYYAANNTGIYRGAMEITITGVDATFNGTFTITGVPTTTTFTYAKVASNVTSTAVSPVGTGVTNVIHFIDYNTGTDDPVFAICDDGTNAYWVTNDTASGKIEVNKKALTGTGATALQYVLLNQV